MACTQVIPGACGKRSCCRQQPSRIKDEHREGVSGRRSTYVEACDIKILFELTEVGAEGKKVSYQVLHTQTPSVAYSESNTPELKTSFAMTEPNGLNTINGCICVGQRDVPWDFGICPNHLFRGRLE